MLFAAHSRIKIVGTFPSSRPGETAWLGNCWNYMATKNASWSSQIHTDSTTIVDQPSILPSCTRNWKRESADPLSKTLAALALSLGGMAQAQNNPTSSYIHWPSRPPLAPSASLFSLPALGILQRRASPLGSRRGVRHPIDGTDVGGSRRHVRGIQPGKEVCNLHVLLRSRRGVDGVVIPCSSTS